MGKQSPAREQTFKATPHGGSSPISTSQPAPRRATNASKPKQAAPATPAHEQIALRAYEIWFRNGCQDGRDVEDWLEAEAELHAEIG
jgi:hypothetical protein